MGVKYVLPVDGINTDVWLVSAWLPCVRRAFISGYVKVWRGPKEIFKSLVSGRF